MASCLRRIISCFAWLKSRMSLASAGFDVSICRHLNRGKGGEKEVERGVGVLLVDKEER